MSKLILYLGAIDEPITDAQLGREIIRLLVAEEAEWLQLIQAADEKLRGALLDLREFVTGRRSWGSPNDAVIIYTDARQAGPSSFLNAGDEVADLHRLHFPSGKNWLGMNVWTDWNDRIESVNIREGFFLALYEHVNFGGDRLIITGPARGVDLEPMGFRARASSLVIYPIEFINRVW